MCKLWKNEEDKLNKSGRKWKESPDYMPYRCAELFCENCGKSLGIHDIVCTNLESTKYCSNCVSKYIKETPIVLESGTVIKDFGSSVELEYTDNYYELLRVNKLCYFNKKGRYIKVKGKRFYI